MLTIFAKGFIIDILQGPDAPLDVIHVWATVKVN